MADERRQIPTIGADTPELWQRLQREAHERRRRATTDALLARLLDVPPRPPKPKESPEP